MYAVKFIDHDELPEENDFVLLSDHGDMVLFIKEDRLTEEALEDAWRAYRDRLGVGDVYRPRLRLA